MIFQNRSKLIRIGIFVGIFIVGLAVIWNVSAPPAHFIIPPQFKMGAVPPGIVSVEAPGDPLSEKLKVEIMELPGHDDIIFQESLNRAFATCMDGWIWIIDLRNKSAKRFIDPPLMASGARQIPGNKDRIVFCSSYLYGESYPKNERVGIYELTVTDKKIQPLLNRVPVLSSSFQIPAGNEGMVYINAKPLRMAIDKMNNTNSRPLMFCNDLDVSRDGKRIYFSEPFSYEGASMGGGAVGEAVTLGKNGLLWCLNLEDKSVSLVGRGYTFVDGVLLEYGKGNRETSVLITETVKFRIMRLFLDGEQAGRDQVVWKDLPGMPDGLDRDSKGRIWVSLLKKRSSFINWVHNNPWIKPLLLRIPQNWIPAGKQTGVIAFSSDCSKALYYSLHNGKAINDISVVVPWKERIYLPRFDRGSRGLYSMKNPID